MRARSSKEIKVISNVTKRHSSSGRRAFTLNDYLTPEIFIQVHHKEIIKTLGAIPTSKNKEVVLD
jgi:hypothetical protein